ncbi:MAG: hypothetical protein SAMD01599839_06150 [Rectinema sp.]
METLLAEVIGYLDKEYGPDLVFLYGSYASQMENSESDIDIIAFADVEENKHDSFIIVKVGLNFPVLVGFNFPVSDHYSKPTAPTRSRSFMR